MTPLPLFILPFDHRGSFARDLLGTSYPVSAENGQRISALKEITYDGFLLAKHAYQGYGTLGVLVDEEFAGNVIARAQKDNVTFAVSVEKSGQETFDFEHGNAWQAHLDHLRPAFAKALVRYRIGDEAVNMAQRAKLKQLSTWCERNSVDFMLEILIGEGVDRAAGILDMLGDMDRDDIKPAVWKLEAVETVEAWDEIRDAAGAPIIVLGRGADAKQVKSWIKTAASSGAVDGFAIGRTIFEPPLKAYVKGLCTPGFASNAIAESFSEYIRIWENA